MPDIECSTLNSSRRIQNGFSIILFCHVFHVDKKPELVRAKTNFALTDAKLAAKSQQLKVKNLHEQIIEISFDYQNLFNQSSINSPDINNQLWIN